jgi:hypothetical protein
MPGLEKKPEVSTAPLKTGPRGPRRFSQAHSDVAARRWQRDFVSRAGERDEGTP